MSKPGPLLPFVALFLFVLSMLACGGGNRQLQSMSISPASASGQVQFTAIGTFSGSSQTSAVNALWWANPPWTFPPMTPNVPFITVSSNGLAQCSAGAPAGSYTVWAVAPVDQNVPLSQVTMTHQADSRDGATDLPVNLSASHRGLPCPSRPSQYGLHCISSAPCSQ